MESYKMAGHLIRRLHQNSTQVFIARAHEAGFDITPVQFAAMDALAANPGIDQASVAALIAYDRVTIGGVINRLEAKGFVERMVSKHDRRAREVRLTSEGMKVYEALLPVVWSIQEETLAGLADGERKTFLALARKAMRDENPARTD